MKSDFSFHSSYLVDIEPGWPDRDEVEVFFNAFMNFGAPTKEFKALRFYPEVQESWIGRFEAASTGSGFEDGVFSAPDRHEACVISCGAGYWVDVEQRRATHIECFPITQAFVSVRHSSIMISTWSHLYAYSSARASWSLRRLADDRLKIVTIDQDVLTAVGFVKGEMMELHVDLLTGLQI